MEENIEINNTTTRRPAKRLFVLFILIFVFLISFYFLFLKSPNNRGDVVVHITYGQSIKDVSEQLYQAGVVKSPKLLQSFVAFFGSDQSLSVGDYKFEKGLSLPIVGYRLSRGLHHVSPIKVTLPEGKTNIEIANILSSKIDNFDKINFLDQVDGKQGYLFPDTYFFYPMTSIDEIVSILETTFTKKTKKVLDKGYNGYSEEEIVVMASLVEEEAKGKSDANIISGILWNRLQKGMPLQVDVAPITYKVKGLPIEPITNFGLIALNATIDPVETNAIYYLHDKDGMIHTAVTYTDHKHNIAKYLR